MNTSLAILIGMSIFQFQDLDVPPAPTGSQSETPYQVSDSRPGVGLVDSSEGGCCSDAGNGCCNAGCCEEKSSFKDKLKSRLFGWCCLHHYKGTCDLFPHYPYCPAYHGYYYFRPYNYVHVLKHQQIVDVLGGDSQFPYETTMFEPVYVRLRIQGAKNTVYDGTSEAMLRPLKRVSKELPDVDEILRELRGLN